MTNTAPNEKNNGHPSCSDQATLSPDLNHAPADEISLLSLLLVLLRRRRMILGFVGVSAVAAVLVSLLLPNIYRSVATIIPFSESTTAQGAGLSSALGSLGGLTGGILGFGPDSDLTQLVLVLKSRQLTDRVVSKYELMPVLFSDSWDPDKKAWTTDEPPTQQDAFFLVKDSFLSIFPDSKNGTILVAFEHGDRQFAKDMVGRYLSELSETLREASIRDSREKTTFVREELNKTADALLREKLYTVLANEIAKETFARAQKYFGFRVIDPPIVPDPNKRAKPQRSKICILAVIAAFLLAVLTAFLLETLENALQKASPEERDHLRKYLPFMKWYDRTGRQYARNA